jgi:hypothetical protein
MEIKSKIVSAPIHNKDMDVDLQSKTIYIFDYDKSQPFEKCTDFLDYINHLGICSDIKFNDTDEKIRFKLLLYYMNSSHFNHILSFNIAILNCIYKLKNTSLRLKGSALTDSMENNFMLHNKALLSRWMSFIDSYFIYMVMYSTKNENIKISDRYSEDKICNDKDISPNIVSLFLDDFLYDYYQTKINESSIKYWKYYYENKLYDNKTFDMIMLNDANFIIKILSCSTKTKQFEIPSFI